MYLLFLLALVLAEDAQFVYDGRTLAVERNIEGCVVRSWEPPFPDTGGRIGAPFVSTIACGATGANFNGVATRGALSFYLQMGSVTFDGAALDTMGDAFWLSDGAYVNATVAAETFVYVVGGEFALDPSARLSTVSSVFGAPRSRIYRSKEAIAGTWDSANVHDKHVGNGTTLARDLVFSKGASRVDPPTVTVLNCAYDVDPFSSFVWFHLHPAGAVYLPFVGEICFQTAVELCVVPGEARWTAPNLFYHESFKPRAVDEPAASAARALVDAVFDAENASKCKRPVVFAVTNFDPDDLACQPNFDDMPDGPGKWGLFETMTVRATTITAVTSVISRRSRPT